MFCSISVFTYFVLLSIVLLTGTDHGLSSGQQGAPVVLCVPADGIISELYPSVLRILSAWEDL